MSSKYHIAQTGKNAGKYVPCNAKVSCRIGGEHLSKEAAELKNLFMEADQILTPEKKTDITNNFSDIGTEYISHQEILKRQGFEINVFETFGSYQGDYAAIVQKDGKVGLAIIGYGSCGGCDALEGIHGSITYPPSEEDYKENPDAAKEQAEYYEESVTTYHKDLQEYAEEIERGVRWGTYDELKQHITGEDGVIKWYSNDYGFKESQNILLKGLKEAYGK